MKDVILLEEFIIEALLDEAKRKKGKKKNAAKKRSAKKGKKKSSKRKSSAGGLSAKTKETLRVDLWTKDMPVNEMFIMYHQTLMGMASTLERSTGQDKLADALRDYCAFFAEETKIK